MAHQCCDNQGADWEALGYSMMHNEVGGFVFFADTKNILLMAEFSGALKNLEMQHFIYQHVKSPKVVKWSWLFICNILKNRMHPTHSEN
jgi:hypothetical protein